MATQFVLLSHVCCSFFTTLEYDVSRVKHIHDGNPVGSLSFLTSLSSTCYELNRAIATVGVCGKTDRRAREDVLNYIVNSNPATNASH